MIRILAALTALLLPAAAFAGTIACPEKITTHQEITGSYENWASFLGRPTEHYLLDYDMYDGPPEQEAQLKPDTADTDSPFTLWKFDATTPQNLWVVCTYGGTLYKLKRHVPDPKINQCRLNYDEIGHNPLPLECN